MYERELTICFDLLAECGVLTKKLYTRTTRFQIKRNNTPVTTLDRKLEKLIYRRIHREFPHDGFIGEEHGATKGTSGRFWAIDPIDGTNEYIHKTGQFSSMIALVKGGKPVLGVIHAPILEKTYYAIRNHGSFCISRSGKHKKLLIKNTPITIEQATFGGPQSHSQTSAHGKKIRSLLKVKRRKPIGSVGLDICNTAEGKINASLLTAVSLGIWDIAAGEVIAREAGANVSDVSGKKIHYQWGRWRVSHGIIVAVPKLHTLLLRKFKQLNIVSILTAAARTK